MPYDHVCGGCGGSGISSGHEAPSSESCPACLKAREDRVPLVELLRRTLRPAVELRLGRVEDARTLPGVGTRFGGAPYAETGETWPACPGCTRDLTFVGQFDARQTAVPGAGLLTFFYCRECVPCGLDDDVPGSWAARIHPRPDPAKARSITPGKKPPRETRPCIVREVPVLSHPAWDEVAVRHPELLTLATRLCPDEPYAPYHAAVRDVLGDYRITDPLGGYGRWIQSEPRLKCGTCGGALDFVVQMDSVSESECDWGLSGLAYLLACPIHPAEVALDIQRT